MFLPIVFRHRHRIERITFTAERRRALEECAVGSDQLLCTLGRWRHGIAQQREEEKVAATGHTEERRTEKLAVERIDKNRPLAHVIHTQSGQCLIDHRMCVGGRDEQVDPRMRKIPDADLAEKCDQRRKSIQVIKVSHVLCRLCARIESQPAQ